MAIEKYHEVGPMPCTLVRGRDTMRGDVYVVAHKEGVRSKFMYRHESWYGQCTYTLDGIEEVVPATMYAPCVHILKG